MSVEQEQPMQDPEEEEDEDFEDEEFEDEEFEEGDDEEIFIEEGEGEFMDMGSLLGSVLTTENGDTVCSALVSISNQLEMQNRIMIKILAQLQKKA